MEQHTILRIEQFFMPQICTPFSTFLSTTPTRRPLIVNAVARKIPKVPPQTNTSNVTTDSSRRPNSLNEPGIFETTSWGFCRTAKKLIKKKKKKKEVSDHLILGSCLVRMKFSGKWNWKKWNTQTKLSGIHILTWVCFLFSFPPIFYHLMFPRVPFTLKNRKAGH